MLAKNISRRENRRGWRKKWLSKMDKSMRFSLVYGFIESSMCVHVSRADVRMPACIFPKIVTNQEHACWYIMV